MTQAVGGHAHMVHVVKTTPSVLHATGCIAVIVTDQCQNGIARCCVHITAVAGEALGKAGPAITLNDE
jgi:hypothetical protein